MNPPITLEEAWERLFAIAPTLGQETVPVDEAAGRYLAEPLLACRTQPAQDLSAMDGFAVAGEGPWRIVGESRAGVPFGNSLASGEAARISTGAACPPGTNAILIVENARQGAGTVAATAPPSEAHIRRRGFDFTEGTLLLARGTAIGPAQIALARAAGHGEIVVTRRPRLAVIECGDELVADPGEADDAHLPASNGAMVAALAAPLAGCVDRVGPLPDDRTTLARAFASAHQCDVIVTTAGASVGEHDHVKGALGDVGAGMDFWRVAIRPGKPLMVARLGSQIVLGLPGNPSSAFVTAYLFLLPLLRAMQGAAAALPRSLPMQLTGSLPAGDTRREFWRARFVDGLAEPLNERDSSALRILAAADLLLDRPANAPPAKAGDSVRTYWIGNGGMG